MLTLRFYWTEPGWTAIAGERMDDGGVLFIWSCECDSFGEACIKAANFIKNYQRDALRIDQGRPGGYGESGETADGSPPPATG